MTKRSNGNRSEPSGISFNKFENKAIKMDLGSVFEF